jgi:hypothetical protein
MLHVASSIVGRIVLAGALLPAGLLPAALNAQTDLDALMREVVARRDDNWKKLQQYVLDERETIELRGPDRLPMWGERREYLWFIRDGFFVRSPLTVNGVTIGEADRLKYEADYLRREQRRERRRTGPQPLDGDADPAEPQPGLDGLLRQAREPQFISSAYFLRFRFEEGKYALVGREVVDGRELLRVEYYPAQLFRGSDRRRTGRGQNDADRARDQEFRRLVNKVSLVTLWIEPSARQIVKYTFDNVDFDFLPAGWLAQVDDFTASMVMGQPFPGVWLPSTLEINLNLTLAVGPLDIRYGLEYYDYRQPDVSSTIRTKETGR